MDNKKKLLNKNITVKLLAILLFSFSLFLFKVTPKAYAGAYIWYDKSTYSVYQDSGCPTSGNYFCITDTNNKQASGTIETYDLRPCEIAGGPAPDNTCCTNGSGCGTFLTDSANGGNLAVNLWDFAFVNSCLITTKTYGPSRDYAPYIDVSYEYRSLSCTAQDTCQSTPYLYAGQCNYSACRGTSCTPSVACQVGGLYKTCCDPATGKTSTKACTGGNFNGSCPASTTTVLCGNGIDPASCQAVNLQGSGICTSTACGDPACAAIYPPTPPVCPGSTTTSCNRCSNNFAFQRVTYDSFNKDCSTVDCSLNRKCDCTCPSFGLDKTWDSSCVSSCAPPITITPVPITPTYGVCPAP